MGLVLNRKHGETIKIGDSVVTILEIRTSHVRLSIDAPSDVRILRGELTAGVPARYSRAVNAELEPEDRPDPYGNERDRYDRPE